MGMQFVLMKASAIARNLGAEQKSFRCSGCGSENYQLRGADGQVIAEGRATEADTAVLRMVDSAARAGLAPWKDPPAGDPQPIGRSRTPRPFEPEPLERLGVPRERIRVSACEACHCTLVDIGYERFGKSCIGRGPDLATAVNDLCNQLWLDVRFGALADLPSFLDDESTDPAKGFGAPLSPLPPEEREAWLKRIFASADEPAAANLKEVTSEAGPASAIAAIEARPTPERRESLIGRFLRLLTS